MKELVEYIAKSLVDNPENVTVNEVNRGESIVIELKVAPEDMGKVIGKQGRGQGKYVAKKAGRKREFQGEGRPKPKRNQRRDEKVP